MRIWSPTLPTYCSVIGLFATCSCAFFTGSAQAQTPSDARAQTPPDAQAAVDSQAVQNALAAHPSSGPGSSASPAGAADIIVTALKRSESLQKTPAAVTFIGSAEIQSRQLLDVSSLASFAPSVRTNYEETAAQFFIRGVGQEVDRAGVPQVVALLQDGIFIPAHVAGLGLFDVQNIQILPGPQGTLYGSSTIGGVIQVTTNRPSHDQKASLLVEGGNYGSAHVTAIVNGTVSGELALRLAYDGDYHRGYFSNGTGNNKRTSFRLSSLYEPTGSTFSLLLKAGYSIDRTRPQPSIPFPFLTSNPYHVPKYDPDTTFFYPPDGLDNGVGRLNINVLTLSGVASWKFGDIDLSYTSGYVRQSQPGTNQAVAAGFLVPQTYEISLFSNELRASNSSTSRFNWLVGVFQQYYDNSEDFVFGPNLSGLDDSTKYKTYALYGQGTFKLSTSTRLTGGLRLSQDDVGVKNGSIVFPTFPGFGRGRQSFSFSKKYNKVNWKAGVEQDIGPQSLFYAAAQSGSNPGTYDGNAPTPDRPVQPQTEIGFTGGMKNRFFDSVLQLNLEAFLYNYRNQIITASDQTTGTTQVLNARRSRMWGVQLDAVLRPARNTSVHANVGYLNAKFVNLIVPETAGSALNYNGFTLPFSPKITANVGAEQIVDVGSDDASVSFRVDSYLTSAFELEYNHPVGLRQAGFSKTDASITYRASGDRFEIGVWAKNLENKARIATGASAQGRSYPGVVFLDPPRTFGGRVIIKVGGR